MLTLFSRPSNKLVSHFPVKKFNDYYCKHSVNNDFAVLQEYITAQILENQLATGEKEDHAVLNLMEVALVVVQMKLKPPLSENGYHISCRQLQKFLERLNDLPPLISAQLLSDTLDICKHLNKEQAPEKIAIELRVQQLQGGQRARMPSSSSLRREPTPDLDLLFITENKEDGDRDLLELQTPLPVEPHSPHRPMPPAQPEDEHDPDEKGWALGAFP